MGIEGFIYPFIFVGSVMASLVLGVALRRFGMPPSAMRFIFTGGIPPAALMLMALSDGNRDWAYAVTSITVSAVASFIVASAFRALRFGR